MLPLFIQNHVPIGLCYLATATFCLQMWLLLMGICVGLFSDAERRLGTLLSCLHFVLLLGTPATKSNQTLRQCTECAA